MSNTLNDYISWGGFPEVVLETDHTIKSKILKEYSDLMFYKDLVEQFSLKNQYLLKYLLKHMITNPSSFCSINKLFQTLKSQGLTLSKNSLYEYLEYLRQVYILFLTEKYSKSLRVKQQNPSKYYIIDTGLMQVFGIEKHQNIGSKLENIIYLHLRTCESVKEIYYYQNKYETDFLYHTENKSYFINVSDTVHSIETAARETRSLINAQKQYPEAKSFLVLNEWTNELIPDNIEVISALRFLTETPAQF
ncbi:MAG: ATPase [Candidatus Magnetoglobus multicellularis str. Araruama]|uniref:ATPase n=1 Tax=Candidatus Magnetoglobus multicellularis str. Araruama TaxID=890399 RepID=A0A1V1P7T4_9BACT|nr:MAG: ATPase [Candidatus Magnetoglobus multicellularis str. Araruama]